MSAGALTNAGALAVDDKPSGIWGTCLWEITPDGTLTVRPGTDGSTCADTGV